MMNYVLETALRNFYDELQSFEGGDREKRILSNILTQVVNFNVSVRKSKEVMENTIFSSEDFDEKVIEKFGEQFFDNSIRSVLGDLLNSKPEVLCTSEAKDLEKALTDFNDLKVIRRRNSRKRENKDIRPSISRVSKLRELISSVDGKQDSFVWRRDTSGYNIRNLKNLNGLFKNTKFKEIDLTGFNCNKVEDMSFMFYNCENLESVNFGTINTCNVRNMEFMFGMCKNLKSVSFDKLNLERVENMVAMFSHCESLEELDLSKCNVRNLEEMHHLFENCKKLKRLDLGNMDCIRVEDMSCVFRNCYGLEALDLHNFLFNRVYTFYELVMNCRSLKEIKLGNLRLDSVNDLIGMFLGCESLKQIDLSGMVIKEPENCKAYDLFSKCNAEIIMPGDENTRRFIEKHV